MAARQTATERGPAAAPVYRSPLGPLLLQFAGGRLAGIRSCAGRRGRPGRGADAALTKRVVRALDAYFRGDSGALRGLPLAPALTTFQRGFRRALLRVPYGHVVSYAELAARLGTSPRAVGRACASNPLPLVVPCHRVLASDGSLHGYSLGAGIRHKRWLLRHEGLPL